VTLPSSRTLPQPRPPRHRWTPSRSPHSAWSRFFVRSRTPGGAREQSSTPPHRSPARETTNLFRPIFPSNELFTTTAHCSTETPPVLHKNTPLHPQPSQSTHVPLTLRRCLADALQPPTRPSERLPTPTIQRGREPRRHRKQRRADSARVRTATDPTPNRPDAAAGRTDR
jgi:hypothetical protein